MGVPRAAAGVPSYCATSGTPLQAPIVEGGSFGFSVSTDDKASTVVVGQPDATDGAGIVYAYNQVRLCAYRSYELPAPSATPALASAGGGEPPGLLGMMTALSRDGRWLAVAGTLEAGNTVFVYRRASNNSAGGFVLAQKLSPLPAPANVTGAAPGRVYSGSLSISRDGRLVLVSWSVYGEGRGAASDDPYGAPAGAVYGSAQLFRRDSAGRYARVQADLSRAAPPLARTQMLGANSFVTADGALAAVSTRVIDTTKPAAGAPTILLYQRTSSGAFLYTAALKVPGGDGAFAMTDSGSHLIAAQGGDVVVYVREGATTGGKFVYNKRCTLGGDDMNLAANFTKLAVGIANNATLRLAIGNSLDSVFVWTIPLGGKRAYSDGSCPAALDATLTGDSDSQFGAGLAMSGGGNILVIGVPGARSGAGAGALIADISPARLAPPPPAAAGSSAGSLAGALYNPRASSVNLDSTYFAANPSSVLVSARRGSVGVPAPQQFSWSSWAAGSPGGATYSPDAGYSISPLNPYTSGGTPVTNTVVGVTSALKGLGLTAAAVGSALNTIRGAPGAGGLAVGH